MTPAIALLSILGIISLASHLTEVAATIVIESKSMQDCLRHSSGFSLNFSIGIASVVGGHLSKKISTMDHPFKAVHRATKKGELMTSGKLAG